eukprot:53606_1
MHWRLIKHWCVFRTSYVTSVSISTSDSDHGITNTSLLELYSKKLQSGDSHDAHVIELLNILGGIDEILFVLLEHETLNDTQLIHVYQIINDCNPTFTSEDIQRLHSKHTTHMIHSPQSTDIGMEYNSEFQIELNTQNTFLHSLFGDQSGDYIMGILLSNCVRILVPLCGFIWWIQRQIYADTLAFALYEIIMCLLLFIPYLSFSFLSL